MRVLALASALLVSPGCRGGTPKDRASDSGTDTGTDSGSDSDSESESDSDSGEPPPERCPSSEGWAYVSAGIRLACGVHTDGCAECWGLEGLETNADTGFGAYTRTGEDLPPDDRFATVAVVLSYGAYYVMGNQACGVRIDGSATCWGRNDVGQAEAPAGTFLTVGVFDTGSCGLRTEESIDCWGDPAELPPEGTFRHLSIGYPFGLALGAGGEVATWLLSPVSGLQLPETRPGPFVSASAGDGWSCALRADGSLFCWAPGVPEYDKEYASVTPAGTFTAVSVGDDAACALPPDGHPVCFGRYPDLPEYAVPDATFTQISTGNGFVCGITTEEGLLCWGENDYGQATPPT